MNISDSQYFHIKKLFIPKHLDLGILAKKKKMLRDKFSIKSACQAYDNKDKKYLIQPLKELQTIMQHFDSNFTNQKVRNRTHKKTSHRKKINGRNLAQNEFEEKVKRLINLPELKIIKRQAQIYKNKVNEEYLTQKNQRKEKIIDNFSSYMDAQLKSSSYPRKNARLSTIN